jgi:hypothetical protein
MMQRGIGDLLRALTAAPREQWEAVARTLGFVPAAADAGPTHVIVPAADDQILEPATSASYAARQESLEQDESELPPRAVSSTETIADDVPWWLRVPVLPRPSGSGTPAPIHEPLLASRQAPAVLATLCSTNRPTGRIDIDSVVGHMARRQPIRRLPRRARPTLARGVRVSADAGEGLKAFLQDRQQVVSALKLLIGEALVEVGWFLDDPLGESRPSKPPAPGTPVLLLTDLGIGGDDARRRWPKPDHLREFSRRLAACGSPVLALVPYPPDRWPPGLSNSIGMVFWDRRTTVSDVRAARRSPGMTR